MNNDWMRMGADVVTQLVLLDSNQEFPSLTHPSFSYTTIFEPMHLMPVKLYDTYSTELQ